jgi:hypothetical protein
MDYNSYNHYVNSVKEICKGEKFNTFKTDPSYQDILEHVNFPQGQAYLDLINSTNISNELLQSYCSMNDSIGSPNKAAYSTITTSPTSLRYIFHAHLILSYLQKLAMPSIDIVELGGGYGGLCLAMFHFASAYNIQINSYTICDLPDVCILQQMYISKLNPSLKINYVDATTFGKSIENNNLFLISNYCFSEISKDLQQSYINILFPKVVHGFFAWNAIPVYNFGFSTTIVDEYPNTYYGNKYVYI